MHIEYVTTPVIPGLLRCPACRSRVRQICQEPPAKESLAIALCGEPLGWLVFGLGGLIGYATQALMALLLAWTALGLPALAWVYLSRLRRADFLCSSCGKASSYEQARRARLPLRRR